MKIFKKIGKRSAFGILLDKRANCFCPKCVTILNVRKRERFYSEEVHYPLYEIIPKLELADNEWEFFCIKCAKEYEMIPFIGVKTLTFKEAQDRVSIERFVDQLFYGSSPKKAPRFGILFERPY